MKVAQLEHIKKSYDGVAAVSDVTLSIARGEIAALLGANGAGKTTTLEILLGLRHADSGTARLFGGSASQPSVRARVGVTPQQTGLPPTLRVREILDFVALHYPRPLPAAQILDAFDLTALAHRQTGGLSGGELRRLGLALAFVGEPEFVVLDEPTTGLDIESRRAVWEYVRAYARRGGTLLITTHNMEEAEGLASRIAVMRTGSIVADASPQEIRRRAAVRRITYVGQAFDLTGFEADVVVQFEGERVALSCSDTDALLRAIVRSGIEFRDLLVSDGSLEEAVLSLSGGEK